MFKYIAIIFLALFFITGAYSQEPLPDFSIKKGVQNQKVISWRNNFGSMVSYMTIQRSNDSVKNFMTLYAVTNPTLQVNAYTDVRPVPSMDYYRIYYQLKNGSYYFTKAKKVSSGFVSAGLFSNIAGQHVILKGDENRSVTVAGMRKISDSVLNNTTDSLFYVSDSTVNYKKFNAIAVVNSAPATSLVPVSNYMFLNATGDLIIRLPEKEASDYSMIIYEPGSTAVLYKIGHFSDSEIILSKSSFVHTGFYPYELFENGKLKERNRFQIK
ncbi:MAG: hypothetical protein PW786_05970 [Arachidicoccus sp.]|nr:hypothetical protein [Arachidicoccus sp.]